ncbi:GSCFA domain-containing protein [Rhodobium gokarnense]|uniref:GSCFA domain-containing protein n=1 Tax=Rhodobium gokarnense TaxID=364296 RepID=A0ABT3HDL1_9HYPH|nr:GSCFA domain-containing protein [Rhodobium gokarnense]MCW2308481.1 hypothetical protein [Rhodobium gokarnense]
MANPYTGKPDRAFWKRAVSSRHYSQLSDLAEPIDGFLDARIATAGSCFAQHIGRYLRNNGLNYMDLEPAPAILSPKSADRLGYGVYSCRYGNIYTSRQLVQLFDEAFRKREPVDAIWQKGERYYDALRPGIEPDGFVSPEAVRMLRQSHLSKVRRMFRKLDIFVFTLGLTECWVSTRDGTAYPIAPGVIAGTYTPQDYEFLNLRHRDIMDDLVRFRVALKEVNPEARLLFTVSPVPLAATATDNHVLVATTYSKSVLRAVAGEMTDEFDDVHYFPSFEVITGQPTRHAFYEPDLRSVAAAGVAEVMRHLLPEDALPQRPQKAKGKRRKLYADEADVGYEHCEEGLLAEAAGE